MKLLATKLFTLFTSVASPSIVEYHTAMLEGELALPTEIIFQYEVMMEPSSNQIAAWANQVNQSGRVTVDDRHLLLQSAIALEPETRETRFHLKIQTLNIYHTVAESTYMPWSDTDRLFTLREYKVRYVQNEEEHWRVSEYERSLTKKFPSVNAWALDYHLSEMNNSRLFRNAEPLLLFLKDAKDVVVLSDIAGEITYEGTVPSYLPQGEPTRIIFRVKEDFISELGYITPSEKNQLGEDAYTYIRMEDWRLIRSSVDRQFRPFRWELKAGHAQLETLPPDLLFATIQSDVTELLHFRVSISSYDPEPIFKPSDFQYIPPSDAPWIFDNGDGTTVFHLSPDEEEAIESVAQSVAQRVTDARSDILTTASKSQSVGRWGWYALAGIALIVLGLYLRRKGG